MYLDFPAYRPAAKMAELSCPGFGIIPQDTGAPAKVDQPDVRLRGRMAGVEEADFLQGRFPYRVGRIWGHEGNVRDSLEANRPLDLEQRFLVRKKDQGTASVCSSTTSNWGFSLLAFSTIASISKAASGEIHSSPHCEQRVALTLRTTTTLESKSTVKVVNPASFFPPQSGQADFRLESFVNFPLPFSPTRLKTIGVGEVYGNDIGPVAFLIIRYNNMKWNISLGFS